MGQSISQRSSNKSLKWMFKQSNQSTKKSSNIPTKRTVKHKRPIEICCKNFSYKKSASSNISSKSSIKTNINNGMSKNKISSNSNHQDNQKTFSNIYYNNNSDSYSTFPFNNGNRKYIFNNDTNTINNNNFINDNNSAVNISNNIITTSTNNNNNNYNNTSSASDENLKNINDFELNFNYFNVDGKNIINNNCAVEKTYSDPYLYEGSTTSRLSKKCSRHRRKKCKDSQKFGYNIRNLDEFLSLCSLSSPGNIPFVLSGPSILYQTRSGGYQTELILSLGMVVNAIFKNQNWLYVQTPHAEEGYINYTACLPLGILPPPRKKSECWETSCDVFPKPCGNINGTMTTAFRHNNTARSEGSQTPKLLQRRYKSMCDEKNIDSLYLRATIKLSANNHHYAKLRRNNKKSLSMSGLDENSLTEEYVRQFQNG